MRPTTAKSENVFDFNALLHPGTVRPPQGRCARRSPQPWGKARYPCILGVRCRGRGLMPGAAGIRWPKAAHRDRRHPGSALRAGRLRSQTPAKPSAGRQAQPAPVNLPRTCSLREGDVRHQYQSSSQRHPRNRTPAGMERATAQHFGHASRDKRKRSPVDMRPASCPSMSPDDVTRSEARLALPPCTDFQKGPIWSAGSHET